MALQDLREFHATTFDIPVNGMVYKIPGLNARDGVRVYRLFGSEGVDGLTDDQELAEIMNILGATFDPLKLTYTGGLFEEMADDGLTWQEIMHVGRTALINAGLGRIVAEAHWAAGLSGLSDPLPPEPNRATKRAAEKAPAKKTAPRKSTARKSAPRKA